ncbi:MAG: twin-arginine translocation signal domain-containing protein, partial [Bacteroidales bacterium]
MKINRRHFLKQASLLGMSGFLASPLSGWIAESRSLALRWIWMHPHVDWNDEQWLNCFKDLKY